MLSDDGHDKDLLWKGSNAKRSILGDFFESLGVGVCFLRK